MPYVDPERRRTYQREYQREYRTRDPGRARQVPMSSEQRAGAHREANRRYRTTHPEYRERVRAWAKAAYRKDPAANNAKVRAYAAKRRVVLQDIKLARGCLDCGYQGHPAALHFDHRDPATKSFGVALGVKGRWSLVLAEIDKCDVRCANCHAVRTYEGKHWRGKGI